MLVPWGVWSIQNPDRGEDIGDARLVTGGTYRIREDGSVRVDATLRNGSGVSETESWSGSITRLEEAELSIRFDDGDVEAFEVHDGSGLRRSMTTRLTREDGFLMTRTGPVTDEPEAAHSDIPTVFFNTMPKSGSIFISRWLSKGLGLREMNVAVCLFPDDLIIRDDMDRLSKGGWVCQQHVPAKDINVRFIANRLKRMVVHIRDPRQAMLSWVHHLDNFHAHRDSVPACRLGLEAVMPALPVDYFDRTLPAKIDYQIDAHLSALVDWTQGWLTAADAGQHGLEILITTFERFRQDPEETMREILAHCGIPEAKFDWSARPDQVANTHFRKGETNEWRSVFSDAQQHRATAMLPPVLRQRFNWPD